MSKVILVANQVKYLEYDEKVDYIGIDGGCHYCLEHNIPMKYAIGDFDSLDNVAFEKLNEVTNIIKLPVCKDVSDGEYAIAYAHQLGYQKIILYGATGGRLDHFLALYHYLRTSLIDFEIVDEGNRIYALSKGEYTISSKYPYVSIFACEALKITLTGFKYPLKQHCLSEKDASFSISNEIIEDKATISTTGKIIVVESK